MNTLVPQFCFLFFGCCCFVKLIHCSLFKVLHFKATWGIWCHQRRREWQNAQHQLPFSWSPCTHHAFLYTTHHIIWRWIIRYKYFLLDCQLLRGRKLIFLLSISLAWRLVYHIFKIWALLCLINPWKYCSHNTEFWLEMWIKVKCEMSPEIWRLLIQSD